jgi:hypothetical protein
MLYKNALNPEKNNEILEKQGMPGVFGVGFYERKMFEKPVLLYSLELQKIAENQFVNVVRSLNYYGIGMGKHLYDIAGEELPLTLDVCFASLEYAKSVMETLDSLYRKKVKYEGKEYFVLDWLTPYEVGLHEEDTDSYSLSDLTYARLDRLEF